MSANNTENVEFIKSMGFSQEQAEEALRVTTSLETAIEFCLNQNTSTTTSRPTESNSEPGKEEVADVEETSSSNVAPTAEAKSLKCGVCNKLFASINEAEFHAAKTGHADFSESTEEKKPLTPEERAARVAELQEKLKARRLEREATEKKEALEKEKTRRKEGKVTATMKEDLKNIQMQKDIADRKREQMEEKLYRQKLLDQIKKDKLDRQLARSGGNPSGDGTSSSCASTNKMESPVPPERKAVATPVEYDKCMLQIRLPNGNVLTQEFSTNETLAAVRLFIEMNRTDVHGPFKLVNSSTFPPKPYTAEDMENPLKTLNLAPRATLMVRSDPTAGSQDLPQI